MAIRRKTVWGGRVAAFVRRAGPVGPAIAAVAIALVTAAPLWAQARLSESLRRHVASGSTQKIDVIVHGSADEIDALAARQHLRIKKRMSSVF